MPERKGFRDLLVYRLAYKLAMRVFEITKTFPGEERFALMDQLRRSSRGVVTGIVEGYRKRRYPAAFVAKLSDADTECSETQVSLDFARDCAYIDESLHEELLGRYEEVGKMLEGMMMNPERFRPRGTA